MPPGPSPPVAELAQSPVAGKLRVEVVGVRVASLVKDAKPFDVWLVTVRLPTTAVAPDGTPPRPVTWNVRGVPDRNGPIRAALNRVSRIRTGATGTKTRPVAAATEATGATSEAMTKPIPKTARVMCGRPTRID